MPPNINPKTGLPYPPNTQPQAAPAAPAAPSGFTIDQAFNPSIGTAPNPVPAPAPNTGPLIAEVQANAPVQQSMAGAITLAANQGAGLHYDTSGRVIDKTQFAPSREIERTRTVDPAKIAMVNDRALPMEERMEAFRNRNISAAGGGVAPEDLGYFGQLTTGPDQIRARTLAGIDTGPAAGSAPAPAAGRPAPGRVLSEISTGPEGAAQLAAYLETQGIPLAEQDGPQRWEPASQTAWDNMNSAKAPPGAGVIAANDGGTPEEYKEPPIPANAKPPSEENGGVFNDKNVAGDIINSPYDKPRVLKSEEIERRATYPGPYKGKQMTNQQKMQLDLFYRTGKYKPLALQTPEERKASRRKESEAVPSIMDFFLDNFR